MIAFAKTLLGKLRWCSVMLTASLVAASPVVMAEIVTHPANGVTRIHFKLPGELQVRYGTQQQLTVDAPAAVHPKLDITVRGDTLVLGSKGSFKSDKTLKFIVTLQALRTLKSEGSGKVEITNFSGNDIEIDAAGSGDIVLKNVKPGKLAISIKGSCELEASGSGNALLAQIAGTGTIDAVNFRAQVVEASIAGSGDIRVHADKSLKAVITGAGTIGYQGKAKVTQSVTGAGSIDRL